MNHEPKKNTEDQESGNAHAHNSNNAAPIHHKHKLNDAEEAEDELEQDDTDKYLAMEQPGVQFTEEVDNTRNSDQIDYSNPGQGEEWSEEGGNSKNSDAFNQDDYILDDNIDLDEDENQSISSDDEDFEQSNERYTNE